LIPRYINGGRRQRVGTAIALLKGFRGSISGDGPPTRVDNGIVVNRNHRGEFIIRSINDEILGLRIPNHGCLVGNVVERINDRDVRFHISLTEVVAILPNELLTSIVARPSRNRNVNNARLESHNNGVTITRNGNSRNRNQRFLIRITDEQVLRQRIPNHGLCDGYSVYSINGQDTAGMSYREVSLLLTSARLQSLGARPYLTPSVGIVQGWDFER